MIVFERTQRDEFGDPVTVKVDSRETVLDVETTEGGRMTAVSLSPRAARRLAHDLLAAAMESERAQGLRP